MKQPKAAAGAPVVAPGGAIQLRKFIERKLTPFEVLSCEAYEIIEETADTVLEEVGIDLRFTR